MVGPGLSGAVTLLSDPNNLEEETNTEGQGERSRHSHRQVQAEGRARVRQAVGAEARCSRKPA